MNLTAISVLGLELRRLGWRRHLAQARELYAATRDGKKAAWSIEHAERLRAVLGHRVPAVSGTGAGQVERHAHDGVCLRVLEVRG